MQQETDMADKKAIIRTTQTPWWIWLIVSLLAALALVAFFWGLTFITQPAPAAPPATEPPAQSNATAPVSNVKPPATEAPVVTSNGYQGAEGCVDGSDLPNAYADISRIPLGNGEGASVYEISWDGLGFSGFDRIVLVLPRMDATHMAFVNNARTVHGLRYCGFLEDIIAYAPTHVDALRQSSQDQQGNRPSADEIPVVLLNLDGTFVITKSAPNGPSLDTIKAHLEMTP
jgi:hypothetical protein